MIHRHATLGDTIYFPMAANNAGIGTNDGTWEVNVYLATGGNFGADAAIDTIVPAILAGADAQTGQQAVTITCSAGNGYAADKEYLVYAEIDNGDDGIFVAALGSISLFPVPSNLLKVFDVRLTEDSPGDVGNSFIAFFDSDVRNLTVATVIKNEVLTALKDAGIILSRSTIETVTDQTNFIIPATDDAPEDDAYGGALAVIIDGTDENQRSFRLVTDYDAGTRTVTISAAAEFTVTNADTLAILSSSTSTTVWDRILTGATHNLATSAGRILRELSEQIGYESGAIWFDSVNGAGGTTVGENGTVSNPSNSIADTLTLAAAIGLVRIRVASGSTITLGAAVEGFELFNGNWTLDLNGKSVSGSCIHGATVSGVATGATEPDFLDCHFNSATLPPSHLHRCSLGGTLTAGSAGTFILDSCYSAVAGTSAPLFDFGSGLNASNVNFRHYSGGIDIRNMGVGSGSYNMSLEGDGQLIVNANCSATSTIAIRGNFKVSGDSTAIAAITFAEEARFERSQLNGGAYAFDTDANGRIRVVDGTGAGELNTASGIVEANVKQINDSAPAAVRHALAAGQIIPFTVDTVTNGHTPTTTEFQADDITEADADFFNGAIVIWTTGNLAGQRTSISDYALVGGIGQFTVVALTQAPANNDTGIII